MVVSDYKDVKQPLNSNVLSSLSPIEIDINGGITHFRPHIKLGQLCVRCTHQLRKFLLSQGISDWPSKHDWMTKLFKIKIKNLS